MANLKYKTRGNSSPQGKPRVYFTCHPEEFDKYFEAISDEILAKQNCAIWYTDAAVVRDDDFFDDLRQMQLFVMPVTAKLLCSENEALDTEFQFAIENHIPVLPLMQESGLEERFNAKCGDLQFLDKYHNDATAIGYDEKLQKYLDSVLIGDELAEKIRAAFDAYVFLSYRKKDRKYARELMRLIHKNAFCRDIAIWYDEFLTPGENFNDSIKEALQKSGLFVLTVTPNVVNEPNYIMTTEYPMAKKEGKLILPAELVPTDREQLSEKYEGLPAPADAHNEAELSEALLASVKKMAIKENDASPEHNFFIGLAYLNGIDVDLDREKGLSLIKGAADEGLLEASDKLFEIYLNGIGVERDFNVATQWLKRSIEILYDICRKNHSYENVMKYVSKLTLCAQHTEKTLGSSANALQEYEALNRFCKAAYDKFPTLELKRVIGSSYLKLAEIHNKRGDVEFFKLYSEYAIDYLDNIRSELEAQFAKNIAAITLNDLVGYYSLFGQIADLCFTKATCFEMEGDIKSAEECVLKGVGAAEYMEAHLKGDDSERLSLANAYCNAAKYYLKQKSYDTAEKFINKGLPIATEIGLSTHSLYAGELIVTFGMVKADMFLGKEEREKALSCYLENINGLERSTLTPALQGVLCVNYEKAMELSFALENYKLCADTASKCMLLYSKILSNADFVKVQTKFCKAIAKSNAKIGNDKFAIEVCQKLFDAKYQDYVNLSSSKAALEYSESFYLLAETYYDVKDYASAIHTYESGITFSKTVMLMYPDVGNINLENTVNAYVSIANAYFQLGKPGKAFRWLNKGLTIRKRVFKGIGDNDSIQKLSSYYHHYGACYEKLNKQQKAQKYYQKAKLIAQKQQEL